MVLRAPDVKTVQAGLTSNSGSADPTDNREAGWVSTWRVYWARPSHQGITHVDDWAETYTSVAASKTWLASKRATYPSYWHSTSTGGAIGDASFAFTTTVPSPVMKATCVDVRWRYRAVVGYISVCGKTNTFTSASIMRLARLQEAHMQAAVS